MSMIMSTYIYICNNPTTFEIKWKRTCQENTIFKLIDLSNTAVTSQLDQGHQNQYENVEAISSITTQRFKNLTQTVTETKQKVKV